MKNKTLKISLCISLLVMMITLAVFVAYISCDLANKDILDTLKIILIVITASLFIVCGVFILLLKISLFKKETKDEKQDILKSSDMKFLAKYLAEELIKVNCPCFEKRCKNTKGDQNE